MKGITLVLVMFSLFYSSTLANCNMLNFTSRELVTGVVASKLFEVIPYVNGTCGNDCVYQYGFSCISYLYMGYLPPWQPISCDIARNPACLGRIEISNGCNSTQCCDELNKDVIRNEKIEKLEFEVGVNYYMKYFDSFDNEIPCDDFTSNTGDSCIQYVDYGQSSDQIACHELEAGYQSLGSDGMAFELF